MSSNPLPKTRASVLKAYDTISSKVHRTPVLTSTTLSTIASTPTPSEQASANPAPQITLLFKCENFQKIGAFKYRGATHALSRLSDDDLKNGVCTHSSGNHAQALALAARERGVKAYIVMPAISAPNKIAGTRAYGAEIIFSGSTAPERESVVAEVQARTGALLVPPYDHPDIMVGQGTLAVEFLEQAEELGRGLDVVVVPCGGGGMLSGVALACHGTGTRVFGSEPSEGGADDAVRGLREGRRVEGVRSLTIADGLRTPVGVHPWEVISQREFVEGVFSVTDEEVKKALVLAVERLKVLVEPSSVVPLATVLFNAEFREVLRAKAERKGGPLNVGVVFSGGNVTLARLAELFGEGK